MPVSDHVWDFIDSQISTKNERPRYWLFFIASLIVFPSLFLGYKYLNHKDSVDESLALNQASVLHEESNAEATTLFENTNTTLLNKKLSLIPKLENPISELTYKAKRRNPNLNLQIITSKNKSKNRDNLFLQKLPELDNSNSFLSTTIDEQKDKFKPSFARTPQCPSFNGKISGFYTYFNSSVNYPFQSLSSNNFEDGDYIDSRNATESGFVSFSFDAGLGYEINDRLFVQAGIMYNQINTKFHLLEKEHIKNTTVIIVDTIYNSSGDIVDIKSESSVIPVYGTNETVALNKFNQIDVPISLGYRLPIGSRFNLALSTGVVLNLKTKSKGMLLNRKGEPINFEESISEGHLFVSKVNMSYTGGAKLETELYPNLFVNAGVNLRYYSGSFNSNLNSISQKYMSVGLAAGIRYKI